MPPGGDWFLVGDDGCGRLDCRTNIKTDDGVLIYVQYLGLIVLTPALVALLEGRDSVAGDEEQYFFTNPRLETGRTLRLGQPRHVRRPRSSLWRSAGRLHRVPPGKRVAHDRPRRDQLSQDRFTSQNCQGQRA